MPFEFDAAATAAQAAVDFIARTAAQRRADREEVEKVLSSGVEREPAKEDSPSERRDKASADDAELDVTLKKIVARFALILMGLQIVIADVIFAWWGMANKWVVDPAPISAWLGATVVEVIGVVYVITSYLFPKRKL
jgi:hypothetical protein